MQLLTPLLKFQKHDEKGRQEAANLEIAKQYVAEFGKLAKENNTLITT